MSMLGALITEAVVADYRARAAYWPSNDYDHWLAEFYPELDMVSGAGLTFWFNGAHTIAMIDFETSEFRPAPRVVSHLLAGPVAPCNPVALVIYCPDAGTQDKYFAFGPRDYDFDHGAQMHAAGRRAFTPSEGWRLF